jgi:hypothetical protein
VNTGFPLGVTGVIRDPERVVGKIGLHLGVEGKIGLHLGVVVKTDLPLGVVGKIDPPLGVAIIIVIPRFS